MSALETHHDAFLRDIAAFPGFGRRSFLVGDLQADSNWSWGYDHGVYCFVVDGDVVYVGRALGNTLGQRIADQLRSTSNPAWECVVTRSDNRVEVFTVKREWAFLAAALEAYLIHMLKPKFNRRVS